MNHFEGVMTFDQGRYRFTEVDTASVPLPETTG